MCMTNYHQAASAASLHLFQCEFTLPEMGGHSHLQPFSDVPQCLVQCTNISLPTLTTSHLPLMPASSFPMSCSSDEPQIYSRNSSYRSPSIGPYSVHYYFSSWTLWPSTSSCMIFQSSPGVRMPPLCCALSNTFISTFPLFP